MSIVDALRAYAKKHGESAVIDLAEKHGAKIHCNDPDTLLVPKCPWVVLDQEACPHLYYGFYPSKYDAALAYCVHHKVEPPVIPAKGFTTDGGIFFEAVRGEPGEYEAEIRGISFYIYKSTQGFGITARKDGRGIADRLGGISWRGTRKKCAEYADWLLQEYGKVEA